MIKGPGPRAWAELTPSVCHGALLAPLPVAWDIEVERKSLLRWGANRAPWHTEGVNSAQALGPGPLILRTPRIYQQPQFSKSLYLPPFCSDFSSRGKTCCFACWNQVKNAGGGFTFVSSLLCPHFRASSPFICHLSVMISSRGKTCCFACWNKVENARGVAEVATLSRSGHLYWWKVWQNIGPQSLVPPTPLVPPKNFSLDLYYFVPKLEGSSFLI